ncbi:recombinase family protein, partial [Elusimicrobiota bacterium]
EDLGRSASGGSRRRGFERLAASVGLGEAGAVFCFEASRLARNGREWHHLLHLCGLMDTLIIDEDGVYSPQSADGKLILGIKGAMGELELGLMRKRSRSAIEARIDRGEYLVNLAPGYVKTDGRCVKHPNERVRDAVALVFSKFEELGSVRQTALWFREEKIELPLKKLEAGRWTTGWEPAAYGRIYRMLTHPIYAGTYAIGALVREMKVIDGRRRVVSRRANRPEDWKRLIHGAHEGFISWDRFLENRRLIKGNTLQRGASPGTALLIGLMRCGRCGGRLSVSYRGRRRRGYPSYFCRGGRSVPGGRDCMTFAGRRVEEGVEDAILGLLRSAALEAALRAPIEAERRLIELREAARLAHLEAKRGEEHAAERCRTADPLNAFVSRELNSRRERAIRRREEAQRRLKEIERRRDATGDAYRQRLREAARDLPRLWRLSETDVGLKRRIVRALLDEIVVDWEDGAPTRKIRLSWKGGKETMFEVRKLKTGRHEYDLDRDVASLLGELCRTAPEAEVAGILNRMGHRTAKSLPWTQGRVNAMRTHRGFACYSSPENVAYRRGTIILEEAAKRLGVSFMSAHRMARRGLLPASQAVPGAPWRVREAELNSDIVRREILRIKRRGKRTHAECKAQIGFRLGVT